MSNSTTSEDSQPMSQFKPQTTSTNNKGDIGTFKVCDVGYSGTLWMTLNKEPIEGLVLTCSFKF